MSLSAFLKRLFRQAPVTPTPRPRPPVIQPEDRSIDDLVFCGERHPTAGDVKAEHSGMSDMEVIKAWNEIHAEAREAMRATLRTCGVTKAGDINSLGCTGAVKFLAAVKAVVAAPPLDGERALAQAMKAASALIVDLAGSGFGLPCFVPQSRYCFVHKTIGGLQDGQAQCHAEMVEKISRELNGVERGRVQLTEASRRIRGAKLDDRIADTVDALSGYSLPPGFEKEEE